MIFKVLICSLCQNGNEHKLIAVFLKYDSYRNSRKKSLTVPAVSAGFFYIE